MLDLEQVARAIDRAVAPVTADEARARAAARTHFRRTAVLVTVSAAAIIAGTVFAVLVAFGVGRHSTVTVVRGNDSSTTATASTTVTTETSTSTTTETSTSVAVAPVTTPTTVALGAPIGRIVIPKIDLDTTLFQGSRAEDERKGPIHDPDSPMPGQNGNVVIAGHRTTYTAPFYRIGDVVPGDVIQITTDAGGFTYIVDDSVIVVPSGGSPLFPQNILDSTGCGHGPRSLVIIVNSPKYSVDERVVVTARTGTEPVSSCAR